MAEPVDAELYRKSKEEVDKSYKKPSAYRSMAYQRVYLSNFKEKYGDKSAFKGKNPKELKGWRNEKWIDIKSFLRNPRNPTACGNEPIAKGEYPLCMETKEAGRYSKGELQLLVQRKNEIGSKRLVKDAYLRDVLNPEETPAVMKYKEKYKEKKMKVRPLPTKQAEKILDQEPIAVEENLKIKIPKEKKLPAEPTAPIVEKEKRARGRPKLSAEQLQQNKLEAAQRRKEQRQFKNADIIKAKEEARAQKLQQREEARMMKASAVKEKPLKRPVQPTGGSPEDYDKYARDLREYSKAKGFLLFDSNITA